MQKFKLGLLLVSVVTSSAWATISCVQQRHAFAEDRAKLKLPINFDPNVAKANGDKLRGVGNIDVTAEDNSFYNPLVLGGLLIRGRPNTSSYFFTVNSEGRLTSESRDLENEFKVQYPGKEYGETPAAGTTELPLYRITRHGRDYDKRTPEELMAAFEKGDLKINKDPDVQIYRLPEGLSAEAKNNVVQSLFNFESRFGDPSALVFQRKFKAEEIGPLDKFRKAVNTLYGDNNEKVVAARRAKDVEKEKELEQKTNLYLKAFNVELPPEYGRDLLYDTKHFPIPAGVQLKRAENVDEVKKSQVVLVKRNGEWLAGQLKTDGETVEVFNDYERVPEKNFKLSKPNLENKTEEYYVLAF